jgi:Outer membrane protein
MLSLKKRAAYLVTGFLLVQQSLSFAAPLELSLDESVDYALRHNPSIQIASKDKEQSQWSVNEAKAGKAPTVSLGSNYTRQGQGDAAASKDSSSSSLRMNWQLYNGGRTDTQVDQAKLGVTSADLNIEKAKEQLKLDTTTDYFAVLQANNMLDVNKQTVDNLQAHLAIVQAKYDAGVVAKSDLLRSQVELANAQQNLIKAQNQRDLAVTALLNAMNMDAGTELQLKDELKYQADGRTLDELISLAKQDRPEMALTKTSIDSANNSVKIAQSNDSPSVSASASMGSNDSLLPNNDNWSVGLSASWNVFDGGVTKSKINEAKASLDKAKLQAEQTADAIEQEVRGNYLSMKEAEKRLETTEVAVNQANEDLYIAQEKYKAGVGTNLDVIDAQLAYTQAKTNHIQALYDYNVNRAKLDKSIGVAVN